MSDETEPAYNAGVIIFARGSYVRLKICKLDDQGNAVEILQGIALPPETARNVAQKLTFASWKIEDNDREQDEGIQ